MAKKKPSIRREEIIKAINLGLYRANTAYAEMSSEWAADRGIEGFIAAYATQELSRRMNRSDVQYWLTLEIKHREIAENTGIREGNHKPGRWPKKLSKRSRYDLGIWGIRNGKNRVLGIVEFKRDWLFFEKGILSDVERLCALLDQYGRPRGGTLTYGLVSFLITQSRPKPPGGKGRSARSFEDHIRDIKNLAKKAVTPWGWKIAFHPGRRRRFDTQVKRGQGYEWMPMTVEIRSGH